MCSLDWFNPILHYMTTECESVCVPRYIKMNYAHDGDTIRTVMRMTPCPSVRPSGNTTKWSVNYSSWVPLTDTFSAGRGLICQHTGQRLVCVHATTVKGASEQDNLGQAVNVNVSRARDTMHCTHKPQQSDDVLATVVIHIAKSIVCVCLCVFAQ